MDMTKYASEWLTAENVSSDVAEPTEAKIVDEGMEIENKYGKKVKFTIEILGVEYNYTPNKTAVRSIIKKHGKDTLEWVGKTISLAAIDTQIRGELKKVVIVV